jgi:hypothetical protein
MPKIAKQEDLKLSQWIYTTGNNSEYLYIIGGPNPTSLFVAKADAVSLEGFRIELLSSDHRRECCIFRSFAEDIIAARTIYRRFANAQKWTCECFSN